MSFATLAGFLATPVTLVLAAALKGMLLIALAFVATHLLRHRSAAIRHAIWASAVLGHLILLLALPFVPRVSVPIIPSIGWNTPAEVPQAFRVETATEPVPLAADVAAPVTGDVSAVNATVTSAETASSLPSLLTLLIAAWLLGALVVFGRYVIGTARVARLARESERVADGNWLSLVHRMAINMGIARPLTLVRGGQLDVPVTWGILYPVVFLPAGSDDWAEERQRFVLVHELAHVKRMDAATQLLTQIALALFWFDPLMWYAAGRIRTERERACDDHVLLHGVRPSLYADELLEMVRGMAPRRNDPAPAFAALAMARRSEFEGRMLAILDPDAPRGSLSRAARFATVTAAFLLLLPLAAFRPVSAADTSRAAVAGVAVSPADGTGEAAAAPAGPAGPVANGTPGAATIADEGQLPATPSTQTGQKAAASPMYRCRPADLRTTGQHVSVHGHVDDDSPAESYTEALMRSPGRCTHALLIGNVTLSRDLTDVVATAPGARASFQELTPGLARELTVTHTATGALERRYTENGQPADAAHGGRWLSELLRSLVLKGGFGVPERVTQLRGDGGVAAVLEEASQAPSSGVKRSYFEALLKSQPRLSQAESDRVLQQAAAEITSSGDLRSVAIAAMTHASPSNSAMAALVARIQSDGDRRAVISHSLRNLKRTPGRSVVNSARTPPDAETMRSLLRATASINSDGDMAAVLVEAAPYAFGAEAVRAEFYRAVTTISSSGDRRRVLIEAARHAPKDPGAVRQFLSAAGGITSDGDRSAVLIAGINAGFASGEATREAFLQAIREIESDGDMARVMKALLR